MRRLLSITALLLPCAACSFEPQTLTIDNLGDPEMEGHTPRSFAGQGEGLFVGDNLNDEFPEGAGVQTFLSFDLKELPGRTTTITSATLTANGFDVTGEPFGGLGSLLIESTSYEEMSPELWSLANEPDANPYVLATFNEDAFSCSITQAAQAALDDGSRYLQLRMYFRKAGDGDGEQDLLRFYLGDPNTNEPGIFTVSMDIE